MVRYKKKLSNLYKSIIYRIFKLIYRKINSSVDANGEDIKLEKIKISKSEYKIYSCHKSKLYTDRVHDTAIIKHNSIIRGPSFQHRNNKNVDCELNVVFLKVALPFLPSFLTYKFYHPHAYSSRHYFLMVRLFLDIDYIYDFGKVLLKQVKH